MITDISIIGFFSIGVFVNHLKFEPFSSLILPIYTASKLVKWNITAVGFC
jgi:hypothetical protein